MEYLGRILEELENSGSNPKEIEAVGELLKEKINKGKSLDVIMQEIVQEIKDMTLKFFESKNEKGIDYITGFTSSIYLPSFDSSGEVKILLLGGDNSRKDNVLKINENTMFDVASITKLFTLILTLKLSELGIIDLNVPIKDINHDFQHLEDFTLNDLIRMHGEIRTDGNVALAGSYDEAYRMLKTAYLINNTRETNKYTDFGAIIIGDTLEKVLSKREGKKVTLQELMSKYIFEPLNLTNTTFNPSSINISGNGGYDSLVHDRKSRMLGGMVGSAGIFTTSEDLDKLAKGMFSVKYVSDNKQAFLSPKVLSRIGEVTFKNSNQSQKGNLGVYVKHPDGYKMTFTPSMFSDGSFSHQGWTGSFATFDPNNLIHHNFLTNTIYKTDDPSLIKNDKPIGYLSAWDAYQESITINIMLMLLTKKYFNMKDQEVNLSKQIKLTK